MTDPANVISELRLLIAEAMEGGLGPEKTDRLNALLRHAPEARSYYLQYMDLQVYIKSCFSNGIACTEIAGEAIDDTEKFNLLFEELAREEEGDDLVLIKSPPKQKAPAETVYLPVQRKPVNKLSLAAAAASLAAVLLILATLHVTRPVIPHQTAVLVDSMDVLWSDSTAAPEEGRFFYDTDAPRFLRSGILKLEFGSGARAIVEGPCFFACPSADRLKLDFGKVFTTVPRQAYGFAITTPSSRIIDLGTEFGVEVKGNGDTNLDVYQGKTALLAGRPGTAQPSVTVTAGQAHFIELAGGTVTPIACDPHKYVQAFDSARRTLWKGQPLDLADMAGGGNGMACGVKGAGIDPVSGKPVRQLRGESRYGTGQFAPAVSNPLVDGVFVPDGEKPVVVSSEGHRFEDCPDTDGFFRYDVVNSPSIAADMKKRDRDEAVVRGSAGEMPGVLLPINAWKGEVHSSLFLHANLGITFDLRRIRSLICHDGNLIFTSVAGIAEYEVRPADADVWVLVDGQVRFHEADLNEQRYAEIEVELGPEDRFLTLAVTESGINPAVDYDLKADNDWCLFVNPLLSMPSGTITKE